MTVAIKKHPELANCEKPPAPPKLCSHDLLNGLRRIIIDHEGTEYTLHLTRQNKLLLTK